MMVAYITRVLELTGLSISLIAVAISLFIFYHFRLEPFIIQKQSCRVFLYRTIPFNTFQSIVQLTRSKIIEAKV